MRVKPAGMAGGADADRGTMLRCTEWVRPPLLVTVRYRRYHTLAAVS